jgi:hypothetical protein
VTRPRLLWTKWTKRLQNPLDIVQLSINFLYSIVPYSKGLPRANTRRRRAHACSESNPFDSENSEIFYLWSARSSPCKYFTITFSWPNRTIAKLGGWIQSALLTSGRRPQHGVVLHQLFLLFDWRTSRTSKEKDVSNTPSQPPEQTLTEQSTITSITKPSSFAECRASLGSPPDEEWESLKTLAITTLTKFGLFLNLDDELCKMNSETVHLVISDVTHWSNCNWFMKILRQRLFRSRKCSYEDVTEFLTCVVRSHQRTAERKDGKLMARIKQLEREKDDLQTKVDTLTAQVFQQWTCAYLTLVVDCESKHGDLWQHSLWMS